MTCDEVNGLLDDLADGLVAGCKAEALEQHLGICPECRAEMDSIRSLREGASVLSKHIEPGRDLWPGIAARLAPTNAAERSTREGRGRFSKYTRRVLVASAAAVAVFLAIASVYRQTKGPDRPGTYDEQAGGLEAELIEADRAYAVARDELLAVLSDREPHLSPETAQVIRDNLTIIDQAVRETRQALDEDPGNERLARLLVATHQQGIDLIRHALSLPDES